MVRWKKTRMTLLVLVLTLVWIVVLAPATLVIRFLPMNSPLVLQGLSGSLWSGAATQATLAPAGQALLHGRLTWRIRPLSVLQLSPCVELGFDGSGVSSRRSPEQPATVAGVACLSVAGEVGLRDLSFDLPAGIFLRSADVTLGGDISGQLTNLTWQGGKLQALSGRGLWSDARILSDELNLSLQTLPFTFGRESDNSLTVELDNGDLLAQQTDTPLHVAMRSTVSLNGSFHTRAQLALQSQAPDSVVELLDIIAEPQGGGLYTLEVRSQP